MNIFQSESESLRLEAETVDVNTEFSSWGRTRQGEKGQAGHRNVREVGEVPAVRRA